MPVNRDFREQQYQFAAQLRQPEMPVADGLNPRRLQVYRELVANNISGFINNTFPLSRKLTGELWQPLLMEFIARHHCSSPLFLDIPATFVSYIQQHYPQGLTDKPFLPELLHYEWLELAVATCEAALLQPWRGALTAPVYLSAAAIAVNYTFPVQLIGEAYQPLHAPAASTSLLLYRDANDDVTFMSITPLLCQALHILGSHPGANTEQWLQEIAAHYPEWPKAQLQRGLLALLPELSERGVIGQRPCTSRR